VGEISLPRLRQLNKAWKRCPPLSVLVRAAIGWAAPDDEAPRDRTAERDAKAEEVIRAALQRFRDSGGHVAGQAQEGMA